MVEAFLKIDVTELKAVIADFEANVAGSVNRAADKVDALEKRLADMGKAVIDLNNVLNEFTASMSKIEILKVDLSAEAWKKNLDVSAAILSETKSHIEELRQLRGTLPGIDKELKRIADGFDRIESLSKKKALIELKNVVSELSTT